MNLRIKCRVVTRTEGFDNAGAPNREDVILRPVDGNVQGASDEDKTFAQDILGGNVQLVLQNDALGKLTPGEYYVDFTRKS